MHSLRHTYATLLIYLGRRTEQISEYLGHADIIMTLTVYARFLKDKKQDAMSDLERLIENGRNAERNFYGTAMGTTWHSEEKRVL
jgi:integrase